MFPLLIEPRRCPVCADENLRPVHVYPNKKRLLNPASSLALLGCERCGLMFSHPLPTDEQLAAYYRTTTGWESRYADKLQTEEELEAALEGKREVSRRKLQLLQPQLGDTPRRSALDFGCGLGAWLDVLQEDGWTTWGIELGPMQHQFAARRHTMLESAPTEELFDLVVVNHVVEHLRYPTDVLGSLARATRTGGFMLVSVPDLGRLPSHRDWHYVKNETHICSYTFAAMRSLLGLVGFQVVEHLQGDSWDATGKGEGSRLKVLAQKLGVPQQPSGCPLDEALDALTAYMAQSPETETRASVRKGTGSRRLPNLIARLRAATRVR